MTLPKDFPPIKETLFIDQMNLRKVELVMRLEIECQMFWFVKVLKQIPMRHHCSQCSVDRYKVHTKWTFYCKYQP